MGSYSISESVEDPRGGRPLSALLVAYPDPPLAVRTRIVIDLLEKLVERGGGLLEPRRISSRMRIEGIRIGVDGVAKLDAAGDDSGVQLLVWEILLGSAFPRHGGPPPAAARAWLMRESRELCQVVEVAVDCAGPTGRIEGLLPTILNATRGHVASHDYVRLSFGISLPTPQPTSGSFERVIRSERAATPIPAAEGLAAAWHSLAAKAASMQRERQSGERRRAPSPSLSRSASADWNPVREPASSREVPSSRELTTREALAAAESAMARGALPPPAGREAKPLRRWTPAATPASPVPPPSPSASGVLSIAGRTAILVAHSVDADRIRIAATLREAGHRVLEATNVDAAFDVVIGSEPSAIIVDSELGGRPGDDLVRRVRSQVSRAATPVLMLTSASATRARIAPFASGADARLMKPVADDALVGEIAILIALRPHLRAARVGLGNVEGSVQTTLRGDLGRMTPGGLLALLEVERRTGLVRASNEEETAGLELAAGMVVRGWLGGERVDRSQALRVFAKMTAGSFSYHAMPARSAPADGVAPHTHLAEEEPTTKPR
jgi:CheY-like chemotaxis protein